MKDTLYCGGRIYAMTGARCEAVLTRGARIVCAGTLEAALGRARPGFARVALGERALIPAFPDAHGHLTALARTLSLADLSGARSFEDIIMALRAHMAQKKPEAGAWVLGHGYDQHRLAEGRHPTHSVLDRVSADCPILIAQASGHMGAVN